MWERKETLEGRLRIDRMWWAVVKVGAIVSPSVLAGPRDRVRIPVTPPEASSGTGSRSTAPFTALPRTRAPAGETAGGVRAQRRCSDLRPQPPEVAIYTVNVPTFDDALRPQPRTTWASSIKTSLSQVLSPPPVAPV